MKSRKGIILAGGTGTRLYPTTLGISKQLLPIYDKPMIYYPISVLMLAGIRDIAIVTTPHDQSQYYRLLGDGSHWGVKFTWIVQSSPEGIAQAYLLSADFLDGSPSLLILGDNLFFGSGLSALLERANAQESGATIFAYRVSDPRRYGVIDMDKCDRVLGIAEKPEHPATNYAITGLYSLDNTASKKAESIRPSERGELEIVSLLQMYMEEGKLRAERMGRGYAWLDTGTPGSLLDAGNFVRTVEQRQGLQMGSPDEIAFNNGWIDGKFLAERAERMFKNDYGKFLVEAVKGCPGAK